VLMFLVAFGSSCRSSRPAMNVSHWEAFLHCANVSSHVAVSHVAVSLVVVSLLAVFHFTSFQAVICYVQ